MIGRRTFLRNCGTRIAAAAAGATLPGIVTSALAQPAKLARVRGVFSAPGFTYSGLYVVNRRRLWAKNGLDLDLKLVQGGPLAMVALTNQEADFICVATSDPMIGWDKGLKTLVVAA